MARHASMPALPVNFRLQDDGCYNGPAQQAASVALPWLQRAVHRKDWNSIGRITHFIIKMVYCLLFMFKCQ